MEILFKNETFFTNYRIIKLRKYAKLSNIPKIECIKFCLCIFIIIGSAVLISKGKIEFSIFILISIIVMIYTITSWNKKIKAWKFFYEFYENHFNVIVDDIFFEVNYNEISAFIEDYHTYYIILNKCGFFLDKTTFTKGTGNELLTFLESKNVPVQRKNKLKKKRNKHGI